MTAAGDIEQRAAEWLVRREQPEWSAADDAALAAWLGQSWGHKAAFWRLEEGWAASDRLSAVQPPQLVAAPVRRWRHAWQMAIAACLALMVTLGGNPQVDARWREKPTFAAAQTPVGGQRQLALVDGSKITLNTASKVRTAISDHRREIWLDRGEAFFDVAHDKSRPFVIHAGDRVVTVLGTRFSLRLDGPSLKVTVERGRVRIDKPAADGSVQGTVVTAGDFAIARDNSLLVVNRPEQRVEEALSWRKGLLTFDRTTLAEAVAEFNRYNSVPIRLVGPKVQGLEIGGTFEAGNADAFVRLLDQAFGLRVKRESDEIVITS